MNKILFFKQLFPYPIRSGTDANTDSLLRFLSQDNEVHFVSLDDGNIVESDKSILEESIGKLSLIRPHNTRSRIEKYAYAIWNRIVAFIKGVPIAVQYLNTVPINKELHQLNEDHSHDVLVIAYWNALRKVKCFKNIPFKIAHLHDANFLDAKRRADISVDAVEKRKLAELSRRLKDYEKNALADFDRIIVQNPAEAKVYQKLLPGKDVRVFPVLVDTDKIKPHSTGEESNLLLLGNFKHHPNVDSAHYVARTILPQVRERNSDARLSIVGHHAKTELADLVGLDGVDVIGPVPNLQDVFCSHSVFVAPMRVGTGIKIKILEAMAAGMAVVTNSLGAEALSVKSGQQLEIRDDAHGMSEVIASLISDPQRRRLLGAAARKFIEDHHSANGVAPLINSLYRPD